MGIWFWNTPTPLHIEDIQRLKSEVEVIALALDLETDDVLKKCIKEKHAKLVKLLSSCQKELYDIVVQQTAQTWLDLEWKKSERTNLTPGKQNALENIKLLSTRLLEIIIGSPTPVVWVTKVLQETLVALQVILPQAEEIVR